MGQVLSSVLNWLLCAYQKRKSTSPKRSDPLHPQKYWSIVVEPDNDFPNQDQVMEEVMEEEVFDDQVFIPSSSSSSSSSEESPHSSSLSIAVTSPPIEEKKSEVINEGIWIKHYCSSHKILLVGEGDFSFSACLGRAFGRADNMVATSLNSKAFLKKNYGRAMSNIEFLRSRECKVILKVDATKMAGYDYLVSVKYDRIVYNFPHAGFSNNESDQDKVRRHQNLVSSFMANAKNMVAERGEIHISHKCYSKFSEQWNLRELAMKNGLVVMEEVKFNLSDYPGYNTKYGFGGDKNFDCNPSKTYKFRLKKRVSEN